MDYPLKLKDIHIRDPYVFPDTATQTYYLVASGAAGNPGMGFMVYQSKDLDNWSHPVQIFTPPADFWAVQDYWAPEMHAFNGKYYLFASLKAPTHYRGTQIFVADKPTGPFTTLTDGPITPEHWECLDGTLFIADDGKPYIVFCHEWVQVQNGMMCALPLSIDLKKRAGSPLYLFSATDAPWVIKRTCGPEFRQFPTYVTDGPFMFRSSKGRLFMLWSSFGRGDYTVGLAESRNGRLDGEWIQHEKPIYENGGHSMIFKTFDGRLMLSLHGPNKAPEERAHFLPVHENKDGLLELVTSH